MFKLKNNIAPAYMIYHLVPQDTVHSFSTRLTQRGGFSLPKVKGSGTKYFSCIGAKV